MNQNSKLEKEWSTQDITKMFVLYKKLHLRIRTVYLQTCILQKYPFNSPTYCEYIVLKAKYQVWY